MKATVAETTLLADELLAVSRGENHFISHALFNLHILLNTVRIIQSMSSSIMLDYVTLVKCFFLVALD